MNEKELIDENADYMLGMYDLYSNDQEIIEVLKTKGLSNDIIEEILCKIKLPSYEKRIRQAKRNIVIAVALSILVVVLPWLLIKMNDSSFSSYRMAVENDESISGFLKTVIRMYFQIYFVLIFVLLAQALTGIIKFFKYNKLLQTSLKTL